MREYQIKCNDGNIFQKPITIDTLIDDNWVIILKDDFKDSIEIKINNFSEAYKYLREEIAYKSPRTFIDYTSCIEQAIIKYFGFYYDVKKSLQFYYHDKKEKSINDLSKKNMATSVERSIIAQALLIEYGADTVFKLSDAIINDKEDIHAYNLIHYSGKYYIFDATIPTIKDCAYSPIVCEIEKDTYDKLLNDEQSITITHLNPLNNKEYSITYGKKEKVKELTKN